MSARRARWQGVRAGVRRRTPSRMKLTMVMTSFALVGKCARETKTGARVIFRHNDP